STSSMSTAGQGARRRPPTWNRALAWGHRVRDRRTGGLLRSPRTSADDDVPWGKADAPVGAGRRPDRYTLACGPTTRTGTWARWTTEPATLPSTTCWTGERPSDPRTRRSPPQRSA